MVTSTTARGGALDRQWPTPREVEGGEEEGVQTEETGPPPQHLSQLPFRSNPHRDCSSQGQKELPGGPEQDLSQEVQKVP